MPREFVAYKGESFYLQSSGRYFQSGRKDVEERLLHRRIWSEINGPIPEGYHVHHVDGDWRNNDPSNLELMWGKDHSALHLRERMADPVNAELFSVSIKSAIEAARSWHSSPEGREWHSRNAKASWVGRKPVECTCRQCAAKFMAMIPARATYCSRRCAMNASYRKHKTATGACVACGSEFTYNKYRSQGCCSRACANRLRASKSPGDFNA